MILLPVRSFEPSQFFSSFLTKRLAVDDPVNQTHTSPFQEQRLFYQLWEDLTNPKWQSLHDGLLMTDAESFIDTLHSLIKKNVKFAIIPDYDTDGICSGTILYQSLVLLGCKDVYLYPPSMETGYGMSVASVDDCLSKCPFMPDVIITTDNGIKAFAGIDYAKSKEMIVLVTDHHIGGEVEPNADVLVNPNRMAKEDQYPYASISGSVVIWKLMMAYALNYASSEAYIAICDLVIFAGISTISDVMPLCDENHAMVKFACNRLSDEKWLWAHVHDASYPLSYRLCFLGMISLLNVLRTNNKVKKEVIPDDIGFYLSPILNTPRRMEASSERAFRLFNLSVFDKNYEPTVLPLDDLETESNHRTTSAETMQAKLVAFCSESHYQFQAVSCLMQTADQLYQLNEVRKEVLNDLVSDVNQAFHSMSGMEILQNLAIQVEVSHGLVGLIAGRLSNKYLLPFIVFGSEHDGFYAASARAPEYISIYGLLTQIDQEYPGLIHQWGGHAQAAGLSVSAENINQFCEIFANKVRRFIEEAFVSLDKYIDQTTSTIPMLRDYFIWSDIQEFWFSRGNTSANDWYVAKNLTNDEGVQFATFLNDLAPFGAGFDDPDLAFAFCLSKSQYNNYFRLMGKEKNHAKLTLHNEVGTALECVFWHTGESLLTQLDAYFSTHNVLIGTVSGKLDINEFRGNKKLQLLNPVINCQY